MSGVYSYVVGIHDTCYGTLFDRLTISVSD